MPISDKTVELYLQLGIAGATLVILLVFFIMNSRSNDKRDKANQDLVKSLQVNSAAAQATKIDKLIEKIDNLVTSNYETTKELTKVLLSNDKDQKETLNKIDDLQVLAADRLNTINSVLQDIQKKVVRIDDRTYACIPKIKEDSKYE